ncbi:MAG: 16S rRNA (cytosine(1402)-N(4))-methyltransferase RsmH [Hyphomicrobiaceae bacterium]
MTPPDADVEPTQSSPPHISVLLREVVETLAPCDGDVVIDGTFGAGGYTRAVLAVPGTHVLAIDRDPTAIARGQELVAAAQGRLLLRHGRFSELGEIASDAGFAQVQGVMLDIGVSSMQLDEAGRGFSFMADGPLDMRMGREGLSARDVVMEADERTLADIIYLLGEERKSRRIASAIVAARRNKPIETTAELARIVARAAGRAQGDDKHPATRTFQALRIYVNDELGELVRALSAAEHVLAPGGRLVVVTFHSLEDRIVKRFLTNRSGRAAAVSRHVPIADDSEQHASFRIVNQRPLTPSQDEIAANPRARSAKLRAAVRTEAPAIPLESAAVLGLPEVPR